MTLSGLGGDHERDEGRVANLRLDPSWRTHALSTGHDIMIEAPRELVEILIDQRIDDPMPIPPST